METRAPFKMSRPTLGRLLISTLIVGLGWMSAQALSKVDQDLRLMYTEYTLAAVDLAHISADVSRYRNTIIRALEASTSKDFERITSSLPEQRARIQHAVDRYASASLRVSRSGRSEPQDLQAVRDSLDVYFSAASRTISLLVQEWNTATPEESAQLRHMAELNAADSAGPKVIQITLALDRLLDTVADVAKDMQDEGSRTIRATSVTLIIGSLLIALLNLFIRPAETPEDRESHAEAPNPEQPGAARLSPPS